ncbi:MAG: hypothetical protein K8T25_11130 [Planctomycetia bacterium]|nr:hypothetical protein [Planctomycetia bacterium]
MSLVRINKNPTRRDLFWFGLLLPIFAAAVGGLLIWRHAAYHTAYAIWGGAAAITVVFAAVPAWRRYIYLGWMYAVSPIGLVVSTVVLVAIFYLVLTPCGLVLRLFGYDPLRRKPQPDAKTYWLPRDREIEPSRYFRQF